MLRRLRNLSMRSKVTLVILLTTVVALVAAATAFYVFQLGNFRREFVRNTTVLAEVIANNNLATVTFENAEDATALLQLVSARPDIAQARIQLKDGRVLASYEPHATRLPQLDYPENGHAFVGEFLLVTQPIELHGTRLAQLQICSEFAAVYHDSIRVYLAILSAVVISCGLLALLLSARLSRLITDPVQRLTSIARVVTQTQNYTVRAEHAAEDELGVLAQTFNEMFARIHNSNAMMQNQIAERTLHAAELREAKERAEAASQAKSQFLANMSHEIRTPLNGVLGMLHLLEKTPLQATQARYINHARGAAHALLTVIGDILDFSRIEAGKLTLESAAFSPRDLMHQTALLFADRAEQQQLELIADVAPAVPLQVIGDANRLRQVLINLIGNALKFTQQGHIAASCAVAATAPDAVVLEFRVRDTGCGIAADQQAHVFDAFSQADNSMTRTHGGTGLGLTICRQLCQLMGGDITLRSTPGAGSEFTFTVKLRPVAAAAAPPARNCSLKLLVVDDQPQSCNFILSLVRTWRGEAAAVADPAAALELLREAARTGHPFTAALVDWNIPGHSPAVIATKLRSDASLPPLALVLLTNAMPSESLEAVARNHFAATAAKPLRASELFDAVMTAIRVATPPPKAIAPAGTTTASHPSHQTILLAEDNPINQEVASEMLLAFGYRCVCVNNGREALEAVQSQRPDLVVMDCQMPELDGYEATRAIREWESANGHPRLPIVALTAHALTGDRERCLASGMDDYLAKPLDPDVLATTLARWLQPAKPALPPKRPPTPTPPGATRPIDEEELLRRCLGKPDLVVRLLQKFVPQAEQDAREIENALARKDGSAAATASHRLKGAALNVSAKRLGELAAAVDQLARSGNLAAAAETNLQLAQALEEVRAFVMARPSPPAA